MAEMMHVRELAELAGLVTLRAPALLTRPAPLFAAGLQEYWSASRCRLERWLRVLKARHEPEPHDSCPISAACLKSIIEEILVSEVLTRVWAAITAAWDGRQGSVDVGPAALSVQTGHLEARRRALLLIAHSKDLSDTAAVGLNRLRRTCERWTDLLLGQLLPYGDPAAFSFDIGRCRDFAEDLAQEKSTRLSDAAWKVTLASLKASFQDGLSQVSPNGDLNTRIAASVLACFPAELFDSLGNLQSLWVARLINTTDSASAMIDQLLAIERRE